MDSYTEAAETVQTPRGSRSWLAALWVAVLAVVGLWILQAVGSLDFAEDLREEAAEGVSFIAVTFGYHSVYFSPFGMDALVDLDEWSDPFGPLSSVAASAAVLVVTFLVAWLAGLGVRRRAGGAMFVITWMATVLGTVAGGAVIAAISVLEFDSDEVLWGAFGQYMYEAGSYGLIYGWVPALLATLVWWLTTPRHRTVPLAPAPVAPAVPQNPQPPAAPQNPQPPAAPQNPQPPANPPAPGRGDSPG
ncbi:hypothetical protein [Nocardioides insulae]|uniref:hypothetical protein n=1 Tax=Nocardioides insulae TaxID=394734 RepID=UPI000408C0CD|nr:hypothetical protein [Nocardioides insulae]